MCTGDKIRIANQNWEYYWQGSTRYPLVTNSGIINSDGVELESNDPPAVLRKIKLFNRAIQERKNAYDGQYTEDLDMHISGQLETLNLGTPDVAVIIPSGGKDSGLLIRALKGTLNSEDLKKFIIPSNKSPWWIELATEDTLENIPVIFVVSDVEKDKYLTVCNSSYVKNNRLKVISYPGFGAGRGRIVGYKVAEMLVCPCWMADDRAYDIKFKPEYIKENVTIANIKNFTDSLKFTHSDRIVSGNLKVSGNFRVLTVMFPDRATKSLVSLFDNKKITFPEYFIASKEDLALTEVYKAFNKDYETDYNLNVNSKQATSVYQNSPRTYTGKKGNVLNAIINSDVFVFGNNGCGTNTVTSSWQQFQTLNFENKWDALKIQEGILHQLLGDIIKGVIAASEIYVWSKVSIAQEITDSFTTDILPWFLSDYTG